MAAGLSNAGLMVVTLAPRTAIHFRKPVLLSQMNQPPFDERKTTEAATHLLCKRPKQKMYLIHLLKLLYIADRRALQRWGRAITWDRYVSMDNGPVLATDHFPFTLTIPDPAATLPS